MKKTVKISNFNLADSDMEYVDSIGNDFILLDKMIVRPEFDTPIKSNVVTAMICSKGVARGKIDLKPVISEAPCLVIILPEQILEFEYKSDDLEAVFIVMSKKFTNSLNVDEKFSAFVAIRDNPCVLLAESELKAMLNYYSMMRNSIRAKHNPNIWEIAKYLTMAFFYGAGYNFHKLGDHTKSKEELFIDSFLKLVQIHFKEEHGIAFYADKMCLTPKYMSTVIKENSGKTAGEWIDERVMLEAKALLKSTNMTVQQIGDELNFPTQSSFGKYFKRLAGVSPKEYREK